MRQIGLDDGIALQRRVVAKVGPVDELEGELGPGQALVPVETLGDGSTPPARLLIDGRLIGQAVDADDDARPLHVRKSYLGRLRMLSSAGLEHTLATTPIIGLWCNVTDAPVEDAAAARAPTYQRSVIVVVGRHHRGRLFWSSPDC